MTHHSLVCAVGADRTGLVREVTDTVLSCGCNITESRMATLGSEFAMLILVSGNWHTLGKLESELAALCEGGDLQITMRQTQPGERGENLIPYAVDLISLDQPGIVNRLASFFANQGIAIAEMSTRTYNAAHTGARMFNLQMVISVPSSMHISTLREEFMELCDHHNLDAILEPVKN